MKGRRWGPALLALLGMCAGDLRAGSAAGKEDPSEHALGEWGGVRKALEQHGVVFNFTYAADGFGIVSGGLKRGAVYNGLLDLGTDVDLEKLLGWSGTHFHVNAINPHGEDGSANYVGDLGAFSNLQAYDSYRLYELWLEQDFFDERFSLRVGQLTMDSEFAVLDAYGGLFVHGAFGTPGAIGTNFPLPIYPTAALGIRLRVEPVKGIYGQVGVYDGNAAPGLTADPTPGAGETTEFNHYGTHWALRHSEGAVIVGELGYRMNQADPEASSTRTTYDSPVHAEEDLHEQRGLAGMYKVGFLYHTDAFADAYDTALTMAEAPAAPPEARTRRGNYALYASGEQELWREPGSAEEGVGIFGRAVWVPADRNVVDFSFEGGVHFRGLLPGRDDDALGLGVAVLHLSRDVRQAAEADAGPRPDFEAAVELVYRYQVTPYLSLQPHAQYIIHPGGSREIDDTVILGLRTNIVF